MGQWLSEEGGTSIEMVIYGVYLVYKQEEPREERRRAMLIFI
jgi:hypothetical protein